MIGNNASQPRWYPIDISSVTNEPPYFYTKVKEFDNQRGRVSSSSKKYSPNPLTFLCKNLTIRRNHWHRMTFQCSSFHFSNLNTGGGMTPCTGFICEYPDEKNLKRSGKMRSEELRTKRKIQSSESLKEISQSDDQIPQKNKWVWLLETSLPKREVQLQISISIRHLGHIAENLPNMINVFRVIVPFD